MSEQQPSTIMKKKHNYARFYALAKAQGIDLEQYKEELVAQFTTGRTSSLREMSREEYERMCDCLQSGKSADANDTTHREQLRKARSAALNRMQRLGIDTADMSFASVNTFCRDPRIAGKPFGMLTLEELQALVPKLEAILRKARREEPKPQSTVPIILFYNPNQLPN